MNSKNVLNCNVATSVADPDPGSGAFLPPGSGIRIRDEIFPDPGSGPFFDDIFLQYLQNPCYVIFITLAYS
jgi:hypothetical protein